MSYVAAAMLRFCHKVDGLHQQQQAAMGSPDSYSGEVHKIEQVDDSRFAGSLNLVDNQVLATDNCSVLENTGAHILVLGALVDYSPGQDSLAADSLKTPETQAVVT